MRRTPIQHQVQEHRRSKAHVDSYVRGKGSRYDIGKGDSSNLVNSQITRLKTLQSKATIDEHGRKLKEIGDKISYLDNGKRVKGVVVGIRQEYYLVERKGEIWKVDRHSIFTRIGGALKGAGAELLAKGKVGLKASVEKAKKLDGAKMRKALSKGSKAVAKTLKEIPSKTKKGLSAELERRRDERDNMKFWKKRMEAEEKENLKLEKQRLKLEEKRAKYRKKIRQGGLFSRALKKTGSLIEKEISKQIKSKPKRKTTKRKGKTSKKRSKTIIIKV